MKTIKFENTEAWLAGRRGKVTGTRLGSIVVKRGTGEKIGFYELIAEKLALAPDKESPMMRGLRLEQDAVDEFSKATGKTVDTSLVIWTRDDNDNIAVSPDGFIVSENGKVEEAVDAKCLSSARHIEAFLNNEIPDDYEFQKIQYFIVNTDLQTLHFAFYDPRMTVKSFFYITVKREDVEDEIAEYLEYQRVKLELVNDYVKKLSF